jgi:protein-S-isoprenylcysteine O-methyltransferase Ste14
VAVNLPLVFTWPFAAIFAVVLAWAVAPEFRVVRDAKRSQRALPPAERDPSLRVLLGGQRLVILLSVALALLTPRLAMAPRLRAGAFWMGLGCLVAGALLRRHCFRMLGADFQGAVAVRPEQPVISAGAYRLVRHPSYSAGLLLHAGLGLALGHWGSLLLQLLANGALFAYRIRVEERALLRTLGEPYRDYMRRTRRLVPWLL